MNDGTQTYPNVVLGTGFSVPDRVIGNDYFEEYLDTSDKWIRERTGIVTRRWAEDDVSASQLAQPAAEDAIRNAGLEPKDIDAVILATVTPDYIFPSTACVLQKRLGIPRCLAFDVNAVCSGFVYAFSVANSLLSSGQCRNALVVGVDLYSRIIDKNDRATCVLFGDGAGAVVLSRSEEAKQAGRGILSIELSADGEHGEILTAELGSAKQPTPESIKDGSHFIRMAGREVFKLAVRNLGEISEVALRKAGVSAAEIDWIVSHQANKRILQSMAKHLHLPEEKVLMNVDKYGNTSAASVPILLAESVQNGTIKENDLVLLSAFGGGITWGAVVIRW